MREKALPTYFAIITADVRYDKNLKANEKLLFAEITALSNTNGYCHASNRYFAGVHIFCCSRYFQYPQVSF